MSSSVQFILEGNFVAYRRLFVGLPAKTYVAGTRFSCSGEPVRCLYYLTDGLVKVYTLNGYGYVRLIGYHKHDSLFGLDGLRAGDPAVVTTEAVTKVQAVPITPEKLWAVVAAEPEFALTLCQYMGDVLRLMCYDAQTQSVLNVRQRLLTFLQLYAESAEYRRLGYIPLSQDSLASAINASRVQTARELADLKRRGLVELGRRRVTPRDADGLAALLKSGFDTARSNQ